MGTLILRPTALVGATGWVASAGTVLACVSDISDATYVVDSAGGGFVYLDLTFAGGGNPTLPARATIKSVTPMIRMNKTGTSSYVQGQAFVPPSSASPYLTPISGKIAPTVTITNYPFPAGGEYASNLGSLTPQQVLDQIQVHLFNGAIGANTDRIYEVWLSVAYDEAPTVNPVTVDSVLSNTATTKPKVNWVYADPDAGAQVAAQVITYPTSVVTALSITDPWAAGDPPAGYVDYATLLSAATSYQLTTPLVNATAYTTFVRAADTAGGIARYGAVSNVAYTINVVLPNTPVAGDLTIAYDSTRQRVQVNAKSHLNQLIADGASFEGGVGLWGAITHTNCTGGTTAAQALSGTKSMTVTAIGAGAMVLDWASASSAGFLQVLAGQTYIALASFRAAVTARTCSIDILWYNNTTLLSTTTGGGSANTTGGWTQVTTTAAAPATANRAVMRLKWNNAAAAEVQYVDAASFAPGTNTTWSQGAGGVGSILLERSYDAGATWYSVLTVSGLAFDLASGLLGPVYDVVLSSGRSTTYRMTVVSVASAGSTTFMISSVAGPASSPVSPIFTQWVLRDPTDVESEVVIPLMGDLESSASVPQGRFKPLGSTREVIISDVSTGDTFGVTAVFQSQAVYDKFETLRKSVNTLLLQSDMTGVVYWVDTGPDRKATLYRRQGRIAAATRARQVTLDLVEVAIPPGQPLAA